MIQKSDRPHPIDSHLLSDAHVLVLNICRKPLHWFCTDEWVVCDEECLRVFRMYKVVKNGVSDRHLNTCQCINFIYFRISSRPFYATIPVSVKLPERSDGADVVCSYLSGN